MTDPQVWRVGCDLAFDVTEPAIIVLHIAPAGSPGVEVTERLVVSVDGETIDVERLDSDHGGTTHVVRSPIGACTIAYQAGVRHDTTVVSPATTGLTSELLTYLRPSRYCPSDQLRGFAAYELGHLPPGLELLQAVTSWVASRLTYELGASGPLDTAVDSMFDGRGVCRDFSHLAVAMLRALEIPARMASAYAPGLTPMDFHAVAEAHIDGRWHVIDPTRLAPRQSLVRIATGRDAADTAFVTVLDGTAELSLCSVTAVVDGMLPFDDHLVPVVLAS